ncbi:MAG: NAD-dependent deacylase [Candidatus Omnitrophica bacterium]|nr:NAD-dependent deacylase [Candidatus Omnitrophota bacterium]
MRQDDVGDDATMIPLKQKQRIQEQVQQGKVVCLTGAGISAESGIPTFRGEGGLWDRYNPQTYATPDGLLSVLRTRPHDLANFIVDFYSVLLNAVPNPAHAALACLEKDGLLEAIITQNIDNLHQDAGSKNVVELHGNSFRLLCMGCQEKIKIAKDRMREFTQFLLRSKGSYMKVLETLSRYFPRCRCGSRYRIDIVMFGEALPDEALHRAYQQLDACDTLLLVGSSFTVHPAASLPVYAKKKGAFLIEVNNESSELSHLCDVRIPYRASEAIPFLLNVIKGA